MHICISVYVLSSIQLIKTKNLINRFEYGCQVLLEMYVSLIKLVSRAKHEVLRSLPVDGSADFGL